MPRLRNVQSGAVVSCSDETAVRLGSGWVPADEHKKVEAPKRAPAVRKSTK